MAAQCSYCGSDLRPNSMFCLDCGQLVTRQGPEPVGAGSRSDRSESTAPPQPRAPEPPAPPAPSASPAPVAVPPSAGGAAPEPAVASPSAPPPGAASYVWVLAVDGAEHLLSRDVVVGRRPAPDAGADAIAVEDPSRTVSRSHAVIRRRGDALTIEDLGSANGTRVERGGRTATCAAGAPLAIGHGDVLSFGDVRATLTARLDG
ncbi:FHA domain-containing protein [Demequina activiva]|uniref:FHA domain-containing protein n=1 Tax=Demequina activiva TaxID=1582364 RepID=A0A919Q300_9MICO|nr:FHA domain-containing protein [Demequina activiva]GIG54901.1 hypothetical protein Dac01nite_16530 [Demequina activiva]